ncbi:hypothetical protein LSTR_LSTR008734 [Laodelphax striatellus]|uniref:Corticotropin-releasing factor-binding protein n=2 Tax=Laodelphax striatellus TaxID=195883 RepID=A0A482XR26_LAOST|nr:hypothetical protein LSTR_LSTR008734 [Laodelphax striatellus]
MSPALLALLLAASSAVGVLADAFNPLAASTVRQEMVHSNRRAKRSLDHIVKDCVMVASEEGHYYYKTTSLEEPTTCGVFLLTDADKLVEIYFDYIDLPCEGGGLISFFDGWELNGQFFPSNEDHPKPLSQRFSEFCGIRKNKQIFVSSQNAALVQYRVPQRGRGFSFIVRFKKNPKPCNILIEGTADVYTLRNYGKHVNCSLTTLYPAHVKVLSLGVGLSFSKRTVGLEVETGTLHKCDKRGLEDFVQLGGGDGLDLAQLSVVDSICGMNSSPDRQVETILCGVTTFRMVSSGEFDNSDTPAVAQADIMADMRRASLVCGL